MEPRVLQSLARKVYNEMDDIKRILNRTMCTITPGFFFEVGHQFDSSEEHARACTRPERDPRECRTINPSFQEEYSQGRVHSRYHSNSVMILIHRACFTTSKGAVRSNTLLRRSVYSLSLDERGIAPDHRSPPKCSFCISFTSLLKLLDKLASQCLDQAVQVAQCPHSLCYNSININTSIFNAPE